MDLRALRERAGLKIIDVAHILECAESSIRNWEKGRTLPKMEVWQVFRMRDLYRCTEAELVLAVRKSMPTEKKEQEKPTE
ncbi:helix-turn-helix transcriptional regulator [Microcoleus sp. MOSTC5]|uniref:helix-turn-helix domain-containing protein n=1 Tax=unclassified Microcoleus TaxID=2642155 RepID=UPI002FCFE7C9